MDFSYALARPLSYIENSGGADTDFTTERVGVCRGIAMFGNKGVGSALLALCAVMVSVRAQAANNVATVIVDNKTAAVATFTYEHLTGSASPMFAEVSPANTGTFRVTSYADSVSGMRFVYTSGSKKCRFSVSHSAPPPSYIPSWKKDAVSIGAARASCTVKIEKISAQMPYDYTVRFTIK